MTFEELKALDDAYIMHTYGRFPVDIDHGEGATLYSLSGRKYIDFTSGIGVNSLGYGNEKWMAAITAQIGKLGHISNLFYTQPGPCWLGSCAPAPACPRCSSATPGPRPTRP